jgi:hypothetical protein
MDDIDREEWVVKKLRSVNTTKDNWKAAVTFSVAAHSAAILERIGQRYYSRSWCIKNLRTGDVIPAVLLLY